jgi:hypothetical protein
VKRFPVPETIMKTRLTAIIVSATFFSLIMITAPALGQTATQEAMIEEIFALANLDGDDLAALRSGQIVLGDTEIIEEFEVSETNLLAALFARVDAPLQETAAGFERALDTATREDALYVASLKPDQPFPQIGFDASEKRELRRLLRYTGGGEFNLSEAEIARVQALSEDINRLDESSMARVSALYRDILDRRFRRYLEEGVSGIDDYYRKPGVLSSPSEELTKIETEAAILEKYCTNLYREIIRYPEGQKKVDHGYRVVKKMINKRPAFVLVHRAVDATDQYIFVAQREYFVGHTYNSLFALVLMLPWEGGTLVILTTDSFTDKVAGFASRIAKPIGRKRVRAAVMPLLVSLKAEAEGRAVTGADLIDPRGGG